MTTEHRRLGVLGGSFDPPHLGHLALASEASEVLGLQQVLFVPAAAPPHKTAAERSPAAVRLELAALAVADDPRFAVSDVEIEHAIVYTRDTLTALSAAYPEHDLVFVMGSDSLLQLETWRDPETLLGLCSLAVALRPGDSPAEVAVIAARWGAPSVTTLDLPPLGISSSDIRQRVAGGRPIRYLTPSAVERRIVELGLYR